VLVSRKKGATAALPASSGQYLDNNIRNRIHHVVKK